MHVSLKVIELFNWDLAAFLLAPSLSALLETEDSPLTPRFVLTLDAIPIGLELGLRHEGNKARAYTRLDFDYPLQADLALLSKKPSPRVVVGGEADSIRPGGDVASVHYDGDSDTAQLYSQQDQDLLDAQEAEAVAIDGQVRSLLPLVSRALSAFREAVRLELYRDAIKWDFLVHSIILAQRHRGWEEAHLSPDLDEAAFLFAAFPSRGAPRLTQETDVFYELASPDGLSHSGILRNSRSGQSPKRFTESFPAIQGRLDSTWSPKDAVILSAVEQLYSDNYRMAVFNAAVFFESEITAFYEGLVRPASAEAMGLERRLADYKRKEHLGHTEAIARLIIPEFINPELVSSGALQRAIDAWNIRNQVAAHLTTPRVAEPITREAAWAMVVSVTQIVEALFFASASRKSGDDESTPPDQANTAGSAISPA